MTPDYVVIYHPGTFLNANKTASVGKRVTTNPQIGEPVTYYKPILSGTLRHVGEIVEKLNKAADIEAALPPVEP